MKILDLGCGRNKTKGAVGIDFVGSIGADVLHDLNTFPYPFADGEFDSIICKNVMEHLDNVVKVMEELHRIGKNGAEIYIQTPHFSSLYSWQDPTHKHHFARDSFDYFTEETGHSNFYSNVRFKVIEKRIVFGKSLISLIPRVLYNLSARVYEKHFTFIFPANDLRFRLSIIK